MGRTDIAFAWVGGQCIAMLLWKIEDGGIGLGFVLVRQRRNACREARITDIV